jgi:histidinol-phosphate aminotransferase
MAADALVLLSEAALADDDHLQKTITLNMQGMQQLTEGFIKLGLDWVPSAGNFVLVDLKQAGQPIYEALLHQGVIVRPVGNYELPNHLRISIGTAKENAKFLKVLTDTLVYV